LILGLVRKKTVAAEIAFYKEFQTLSFDSIPEHIRTFFPTLVSASKSIIFHSAACFVLIILMCSCDLIVFNLVYI
jgi:hypothetical protein